MLWPTLSILWLKWSIQLSKWSILLSKQSILWSKYSWYGQSRVFYGGSDVFYCQSGAVYGGSGLHSCSLQEFPSLARPPLKSGPEGRESIFLRDATNMLFVTSKTPPLNPQKSQNCLARARSPPKWQDLPGIQGGVLTSSSSVAHSLPKVSVATPVNHARY